MIGNHLFTVVFCTVFALIATYLIIVFIVNVIQVIIARRQESDDDTLDEIE